MYNTIYDFPEKYKLIYLLQCGFRQHYSTSYALYNLIEPIMMKVLDEGTFPCRIFVDLQSSLILLITTLSKKEKKINTIIKKK